MWRGCNGREGRRARKKRPGKEEEFGVGSGKIRVRVAGKDWRLVEIYNGNGEASREAENARPTQCQSSRTTTLQSNIKNTHPL